MISQRYAANVQPTTQEIASVNMPEITNKSQISFHRYHNYPVRESIMPPPPHNTLTTLNNNNSTKTYNRNYHWNNHKRSHPDVKHDRHVTQHCDKKSNPSSKASYTEKPPEKKSKYKHDNFTTNTRVCIV